MEQIEKRAKDLDNLRGELFVFIDINGSVLSDFEHEKFQEAFEALGEVARYYESLGYHVWKH